VESYLLILGERQGLGWVIANQAMAFGEHRAAMARRLRPGDRLLLYTTRGCFHNPTRDVGRIIGSAKITDCAAKRSPPLTILGRTFPWIIHLAVGRLAPLRQGLPLAPLVASLDAFPDAATWSVRLRQPLLRLSPLDTDLLSSQVKPHVRPLAEVRGDYERLAPSFPSDRAARGRPTPTA
jgi:hypothetical protein